MGFRVWVIRDLEFWGESWELPVLSGGSSFFIDGNGAKLKFLTAGYA